MSADEHRTLSFNPRVQLLLAEYEAALAAGQPLSLEELLARHPEAEESVRQAVREILGRQETLAPSGPTPRDGVAFAPQRHATHAAGLFTGSTAAPTIAPPQAGLPVFIPTSKQFGDYELLEELARGGMGVVFKARQLSLDRVVALKMILAGNLASDEQIRRFHHEAEEAGRLDHPNIVPIYQVGEHQGQHFFSMKLIEGGSLCGQLTRFRSDPRGAANLVATVARAVHYAHQRGVLHRDLKPGNILLDAQGQPHVTDFGLAKQLGTQSSDTRSGSIVGTPSYMAPEQAAARKDLTTAVDTYALGAILYELLTGQPPFDAPTPLDTLMQALEQEPKPPRSLNPVLDRDLETICLTCLAKEPAQRYPSAAALADDLDRWHNGEPIKARPVGTVERILKWMRRRPAAATLALVSAAGAVSLLGMGWYHNLRLQRERDRAEAYAREADAGFRKRQEIIDDLMVRIDGRLENYGSELTSVRMEFLDEFRKLNEQLRKERGNDLTVRRQAAFLNQRIGDLELQKRDVASGEPAYQQAIALFRQLAAENPGNEDYRRELARTISQLAQLYHKGGRRKQARTTYEEAIREREQLVKEFPANPAHRLRTANYRFLLANLLEDLNLPQEAEAHYRQALQEQEKLVQEFPRDDTLRNDYLQTLVSLAVLLEPTRPDEAIRLQEQVARTCRQAAQKDYSSHGQNSVNAHYDLAAMLVRAGRHAELARLAVEVGQAFSQSGDHTYHAACYGARAVPLAAQDQTLSSQERAALADRYGKQAVELLTRSIQLGWKERHHMFLDGDLDPLRPRKDFQELLTDLDKRLGKPLATAELVTYLVNRYRNERASVQATIRNAGTVAERKRAGANLPQPEEFANRLLTLAEENPKDAASVTALSQVLAIASTSRAMKDTDARRARRRALELLERDHFNSPAFPEVCEALARTPSADGNQLLQNAFAKHQLPEARGQAGFWLAQALSGQADVARRTDPARAATLTQQAEALFEKVIAEYGTLPHGKTTLGEAAGARLHEARHLKVGCPAEDISGEDLNGQPMKLSDFRGKVVLLDFWANWCGFCRQMYPDEKALVARLKNEPFALLGVNCDDNKADVLREIERHGINWRSWWDADGKIRTRWQLEGYPLLFLIDHKGIIRQRYSGRVGGAELNQAVNELLRECKQEVTRQE